MRAIDTNVLVRFLTRDDPRQGQKAQALIEGGDIFVPTTVLLEAEWVLRSAYALPRADVVGALRLFAGLPGVRLEAPEIAAQALAWADGGMDFADALHVAASRHCDSFRTFDARLLKGAPDGVQILEP